MRLFIQLTDAMTKDLLTLAEHARRHPRAQAEVLLEKAIERAIAAFFAHEDVEDDGAC